MRVDNLVCTASDGLTLYESQFLARVDLIAHAVVFLRQRELHSLVRVYKS